MVRKAFRNYGHRGSGGSLGFADVFHTVRGGDVFYLVTSRAVGMDPCERFEAAELLNPMIGNGFMSFCDQDFCRKIWLFVQRSVHAKLHVWR